MDYEIEFKMVEIKDITKIQRSEIIEDDTFETKVSQVKDITDEYCKSIMDQVKSMIGLNCRIRYIGCIKRIGNYEFEVSSNDINYIVIFQLDTYEWNRQFTIKIGYDNNRNGFSVIETKKLINGYDHFMEKLKLCVKNALIRDWYACVWICDNQSLELSKEVYAEIYMAENELRALISKVMLEHFGIEWNDRPEFYKLNANIKENSANIKRNVPSFNNIDVNLYTVTLETLMETVKANIYSDSMQDSPEIQKAIKERIFATTNLDRMQSALAFLKNRYTKKYNIWEKFFQPLVSDPVKWEEALSIFIANRNHVAHNKLLDYLSEEKMLDDTRRFREYIQNADRRFNRENQSEEVEETLQAIAEQREYEREAQLEIIETESGVKIRNMSEILKLFQDTVDEIYTDTINVLYFEEDFEITEDNILQYGTGEQILFAIDCKNGKALEVLGIVCIDDSEGTESVLQIQVCDGDDNIVETNLVYINGEAEYNQEQVSYMPIIEDHYDNSGVEIIKDAIEKFVSREREVEEIISYNERCHAEEDWSADAADVLEDRH